MGRASEVSVGVLGSGASVVCVGLMVSEASGVGGEGERSELAGCG